MKGKICPYHNKIQKRMRLNSTKNISYISIKSGFQRTHTETVC